MKKSIIFLLEDASKKMSGYAALFNYRLMNLCIQASPEALLPIQVETEGTLLNLEDVAVARNAPERDDQFEIYPKDRDYLLPLLKGVKKVHPEFKIEMKDFDAPGEDEPVQFILATMPEVNDVRHEVLTDAVAALSDECDAKIQATFTYYSGQIPLKLAGAPEDEINEAKDALQEVFDNHKDLCKKFRTQKEDEIEEAYQHFQAEKEELKAKLAEKQAALGEQAGTQMKWEQDDE